MSVPHLSVMADQDPFSRHVIVSNKFEASAHSTRSFEFTLYMFPRTIRSPLCVVFGEPHADTYNQYISKSHGFTVTNKMVSSTVFDSVLNKYLQEIFFSFYYVTIVL